ncbi:MAG: hypothetical protein HW416_3608 [Chloroflexi bacterium]|nr:hypothetical protein [Chloroflexota bacterium]
MVIAVRTAHAGNCMANERSRSMSLAKPVGAGLVFGAALGVLYTAARHYGRDRANEIIDWNRVTSVALRTSGGAQRMSEGQRAASESDYSAMLAEISAPLSEYTGSDLRLADTPVQALDRAAWIQTNVESFRHLLRPFEELYRDATGSGGSTQFAFPGMTAVGRLALSTEMGVLLGYLARRVLGQYDIGLLGVEQTEPGKLYFVEPNVTGVQQQLGLPPREFRVWLALHEATHAHEFEGHPWVRGYMNDTLQTYLNSMVESLRESGSANSIREIVGRAADRLWIGGSLLDALMTPYQRELVSRLQAFMCVMEGYSNHVMQAVGSKLLPHFDEIERQIEARSREKSAAEQLFLRLTGLQMKLDQYRLGTAFVNNVEQQRGIAFVNRLWEDPSNLPTELEIREPAKWMQRM